MAMERPDSMHPPVADLNHAESLLHTPELLQIIISNLDKPSLPAAARVSKLWSELALDELWRDCRHLKHLLSILGPMAWDPAERYYLFVSAPTPESWARFNTHYAPRIHALSAIASVDQGLHPSVFHEIELERIRLEGQNPPRHIFPNLRSMSWFTYKLLLELSFPLLHPGIKSFTIEIPVMSRPTISEDDWHPNALRDLAMPSRMPQLSRLVFLADWHALPGSTLEDILVEFWEQTLSLPSLEAVRLGSASLTSRIGSTLGRVKSLTKLEVTTVALWEHDQALNHDICRILRPPLIDAFPKLEHLNLSASVSDCVRLLTYFDAPNLVHLDLDRASVYEDNRAFEMKELLGLLAERYSDTLQFLSCRGSTRTHNAGEGGGGIGTEATIDDICFNLHTLKPLLQLTHLHTLAIGHNYPLALTDADAETLLSHLHRLEMLNLNCQPDNCIPIVLSSTLEGAVRLSLDVLFIVAKYCPKMRWLGVLLDATLPCPRLAATFTGCGDLDSESTPTPFPAYTHLRTFSIGLSKIGSSPSEIAEVEGYLRPIFLAKFQCALRVGDVPGGRDEPWPKGEEEMWEEAVRRVRVWEEVGRNLQLEICAS